MFRPLSVAMFLGGVVACNSVALAQPVELLETLEVSATNSDGVWSSVVLEAGQLYWIYAEGSYRQAYAGQRCDAEWHQNLPGGPWEEEHVGEQYWYQHDLMIGGWWFDWSGSELPAPDPLDDFGSFFPHTLSSSQTYWLPYPGQGEPIRLWIFDTEYVDNQGSLTVRIWRTGCPGDVNGDGDTDQQDLGILLSAWGTCVGDSDFIPEADLDDDGCIGQSDLGILLADWNCGKG